MKKKLLTIGFPLFFLLYSCNMMKTKADLIVYNARIYTVDSVMTVAEAMAVSDGKIIATGTSKEILGKFKVGNKFDAMGSAVFPGFIDAHCHYYGYALNLRYIALNGCTSFAEVMDRLKKSGNYKPGDWIVGRGWDHNLWKDKVFPDRKKLDEAFPSNPVVLTRIDGHVVLANGPALGKGGFGTTDSYKPGEVERLNGRLTGILSERAADHMRNCIPKPGRDGLKELLGRARDNCYEVGLTAVSDAGLDEETLALFDEMASGDDSSSMIRIYAMLDPSPGNFSKYVNHGPYHKTHLEIRSVKVYADGSLGSRTALLKTDYTDKAGQKGIQVITADSLRNICRLCIEHGYQVNTHAIGDSANKFVLDIYAEFLKGKNDLRWRIEHCQVVDPTDIKKFGDFSVIPSVQATHATSDMAWAGERLGPERIKWAYAYKDLLMQNGWLPNGTDFPIENISPVYTFYAAFTRKGLDGNPPGGFQPENALSREEALRSVTIWAAKSGFREHFIGSLEKGKFADFVILDRDIMTVKESEVPAARVVSTYLSGRQVYPKP